MSIKIYQGKPNPEDYKEIAKMIKDGYTSGIGRPFGIIWEYKK